LSRAAALSRRQQGDVGRVAMQEKASSSPSPHRHPRLHELERKRHRLGDGALVLGALLVRQAKG
jgi:hypothetical protein